MVQFPLFKYLVDMFSDEFGLDFTKSECKAKCCVAYLGNEKIIIAKPQTYMNLSGESVLMFKQKYKLDNKDIYVFCDDIDLPLGKVRIRHEGSGGTHNGMRNIVSLIGQDFNRIKVGIGRDEKFANLADFVLSVIPKEKQEILDKAYTEALQILHTELGE